MVKKRKIENVNITSARQTPRSKAKRSNCLNAASDVASSSDSATETNCHCIRFRYLKFELLNLIQSFVLFCDFFLYFILHTLTEPLPVSAQMELPKRNLEDWNGPDQLLPELGGYFDIKKVMLYYTYKGR